MSKKKVEMHYDGYNFKMDLFKDLDLFYTQYATGILFTQINY